MSMSRATIGAFLSLIVAAVVGVGLGILNRGSLGYGTLSGMAAAGAVVWFAYWCFGRLGTHGMIGAIIALPAALAALPIPVFFSMFYMEIAGMPSEGVVVEISQMPDEVTGETFPVFEVRDTVSGQTDIIVAPARTDYHVGDRLPIRVDPYGWFNITGPSPMDVFGWVLIGVSAAGAITALPGAALGARYFDIDPAGRR